MSTLPPGFDLLREEHVDEIKADCCEYRHAGTGARILSLSSDDTNKVFGISFRTPPADSTGIAHILEHSVLCGSRKYPVKEPFVELLKGSLQTFLNAFTYPDKTCYPVASENLQDFYNLVDVYLDAVFFPRITRHVFEQEGWHLERESPDAPLLYKGVVFNEMKGVYSSPEDILGEISQQTLFPDTTYGVDSGGDPREIPNLTFEQFKDFHKTYYHPVNAYIYFYGDDDPGKRLAMLAPYLDAFDAAEHPPPIPLQPRFADPVRVTRPYDHGEEKNTAAKNMFTVNWLLPEVVDPDTNLALGLLSYALVGTPASPLRKALIESGLGEDLTGAGFANYLQEMYFGTGLRGVTADDLPRAEALVSETLERLARDGIEQDTLEAAFNTVEFRLRESNTGGYPRGLAYMLSALTFWLYDGDPLIPLRFEAPLARLRSRWEGGESVFEDLIRQHFMGNPHRSMVVLEPVEGTGRQDEEAEQARLSAIEAELSEDDQRRVIENTRALQEAQAAPDSPEDLARIPSVGLEDLDPSIRTIPSFETEVSRIPALVHDLPTNGIVYLDLAFDLNRVPQRLLPLVSLFGEAILEMGNDREDFVALTNRIGRDTGGLGASAMVTACREPGRAAAHFVLRGKATAAKTGPMLSLMSDVLMKTRFDDRERFKQIVLEERAGFEAGIVPDGTSVAGNRLRSQYHLASWISEQMKGITNLFFLRELVDRIESNWDEVAADLETLRATIIQRNHALLNVTTDSATWQGCLPATARFLDGLPSELIEPVTWTPSFSTRDEGLTIPAKVNYVTKGADIYQLGYTLQGSVSATVNLLRAGYLWDRIRVQGGAYGAFCALDPRSGIFSFGSYRDPNLDETVRAFDEAGDYLRQQALDSTDLRKGIVGAVGALDTYQLPDAKGYTSLIRHLAGETDDHRQQLRDQLLATTREDVVAFADALDTIRDHGTVVVVGNRETLSASAHKPEITPVL